MAAIRRPTEQTNEVELDQFNIAMRSSPAYQAFLQREGLVDRGQGVHMNKGQRKRWALELQKAGLPLEKGMEIDAGGNVDTKPFNWKKWGAIAGGAALAAFGVPGVMPGLMGIGGGSSAIPSLAAGIPSSAAQALGPLAAAGGAGATATGAAVAGIPSLKTLLLGKGLDFGLGALQGALSGDDATGQRTRPAFEGTNVAQTRVQEHFLNALNEVFGKHMADVNKGVDLSHLQAQTPSGFSGGLLPLNIGLSGQDRPGPVRPGLGFNGDFRGQPFSGVPGPAGPGFQAPNLDPNAPLTPEQIRRMLGGQ